MVPLLRTGTHICTRLLLKWLVKLRFSAMEEGISVKRQTDELTGLSSIQIIDPAERPAAGKDLTPSYYAC